MAVGRESNGMDGCNKYLCELFGSIRQAILGGSTWFPCSYATFYLSREEGLMI